MNSFSTTVFGKCIIAGEHAVIRGAPALVVPVIEKKFQLTYKNKNQEFSASFQGEMKEDLQLVFWGLVEKAANLLGQKRNNLTGELNLKNSIPVGAGLGASAALCVAMGKFFEHIEWVNEGDLYEFCRQLENLFHGESSGVDIAAALMATPLEFQREYSPKKLKINWQPEWYLSYSGKKSITSSCVNQVKEFWITNKKQAQKIDDEMKESVLLIKKALAKNQDEGLLDLVEAIQKAKLCFEHWGLTQGGVDKHIHDLMEFGALAAKPTGSGGGGYILSLWRHEPPKEILKDLIPLEVGNIAKK